MIYIQSTPTDGSGMSTREDPGTGSPVEPSIPAAEPGTQAEVPTPNLIQRMLGPIWRRVRSHELSKLVAVAIGVLLLLQMALCLAVSHVLKEAQNKNITRNEITNRQAKLIHYYLLNLLINGLGLFSMWNQRFWFAVVYLVTLLANGHYVLSILSCTVRSDCPTTALFVAIPQLASLAWVYWLMLGLMYVLAGVVAYYVAITALDKFGWFEDNDSISWPVDSSASVPEEPTNQAQNPSARDANQDQAAVASSSGINSDPTNLAMFSDLSQDVSSIFTFANAKAIQTAEPSRVQSIMMETMVHSLSSTDMTIVMKNKFQGTMARVWNTDPKYPETTL